MRTFAHGQKPTRQTKSAIAKAQNGTFAAQPDEVRSILHLQRTIGNQAVLRSLQARADGLEAGSVTEVDSETPAAARSAYDFSRIPVHAPAPIKIQPKLAINTPGDIYEQEADRVSDQLMATPTDPAVNRTPPRIQRFSGQSNGPMDAAPASVDQALASPGRPLEPVLRQDMEQSFGHDFSRVRVHSGAAAEQSARDVNATAYTVGHNIVRCRPVRAGDDRGPATDRP